MHDTEYRQHRDPHRILVLPVFRTKGSPAETRFDFRTSSRAFQVAVYS